MTNTFRCCAATLILVILTAVAPANAQFAPPSSEPAATPPAAAPNPPKASAAAGPAINGSWIGQLTALGNSTPVNFELTLTPAGGDSKYPDLDCAGKLRRIGSSRTYAFFVEVIAKGRSDKGGRCLDGSVTIARQGDNLALVWFGSLQDNLILAYGVLSKK